MHIRTRIQDHQRSASHSAAGTFCSSPHGISGAGVDMGAKTRQVQVTCPGSHSKAGPTPCLTPCHPARPKICRLSPASFLPPEKDSPLVQFNCVDRSTLPGEQTQPGAQTSPPLSQQIVLFGMLKCGLRPSVFDYRVNLCLKFATPGKSPTGYFKQCILQTPRAK